MKLLCDANISPRLVELLSDLFPESTHVSRVDLERADDRAVWDDAIEHGFVLVSKDEDFHQLAFLYGHLPRSYGCGSATARPPTLKQRSVKESRTFGAS